MERVTGDGVPSGYFSAEYFRPWWNHGMVQGAGELVSIGIGNIFADTDNPTNNRNYCPFEAIFEQETLHGMS